MRWVSLLSHAKPQLLQLLRMANFEDSQTLEVWQLWHALHAMVARPVPVMAGPLHLPSQIITACAAGSA